MLQYWFPLVEEVGELRDQQSRMCQTNALPAPVSLLINPIQLPHNRYYTISKAQGIDRQTVSRAVCRQLGYHPHTVPLPSIPEPFIVRVHPCWRNYEYESVDAAVWTFSAVHCIPIHIHPSTLPRDHKLPGCLSIYLGLLMSMDSL